MTSHPERLSLNLSLGLDEVLLYHERDVSPIEYTVQLANLLTTFLARINKNKDIGHKFSMHLETISYSGDNKEAMIKQLQAYVNATSDLIKNYLTFMYPLFADQIVNCPPQGLKALYVKLSGDGGEKHPGYLNLFAVLSALMIQVASLSAE